MRIIDLHCDTLLAGWENPSADFAEGGTAINLKKLEENGSLAQCFAMYLEWKEQGRDPYEVMQSMYAHYSRLMRQYSDRIRPALNTADILRNEADGVLSSFLTVEDGAFLDGKAERLQEAYDLGVRMISLTWNYENSLAYPNSRDKNLHSLPLKPFGIEMVEEMNRLGIIIDVSHLSEGGFYDVARFSTKPFCASHSCARGLCDHPRNLTDDQLKTIGNSGGMVGINFECSFLNEDESRATFDRIIEHLLYMRDRAGIEAVGFGSDFDGIEDNGELVDYSGFTPLLARMEKFFTDDEIDLISHGNALRLIREVTGA